MEVSEVRTKRACLRPLMKDLSSDQNLILSLQKNLASAVQYSFNDLGDLNLKASGLQKQVMNINKIGFYQRKIQEQQEENIALESKISALEESAEKARASSEKVKLSKQNNRLKRPNKNQKPLECNQQ